MLRRAKQQQQQQQQQQQRRKAAATAAAAAAAAAHGAAAAAAAAKLDTNYDARKCCINANINIPPSTRRSRRGGCSDSHILFAKYTIKHFLITDRLT